MACSLEDDLRQFPDCCDAVRVGSERWQIHHSAIMEALVSRVRSFLRSRKRLPIDQLLIEYERNEPSVEAGGQCARLMYGNPPFFLVGSQLQMDVKGLVFVKPGTVGAT